MIYTGIDMIEIERIQHVLNQYQERFLNKIFTKKEQIYCNKRSKQLASRFAAKEAVTKALGTGLSGGVFFKDIGVENDKYGKPSIVLTGGAKLRLEDILPKNHNLTKIYRNADISTFKATVGVNKIAVYFLVS